MTNTKFRKRALLSSVAMLLVALVALGSATFAWFAEKPTATAEGIKVKTTAAAGLQIKTDTDTTWSQAAALGAGNLNVSLTPASQSQTTPGTFYTITADAANSYAATSNGTATIGTVNPGRTDGTNGVYMEDVYFRLAPGASGTAQRDVILNGVTLSSESNATMEGTIRVSIVSGTTILGVYTLGAAANQNKTIPDGHTGDTWADMGGDAALVAFNPAPVTVADATLENTNLTVAEDVMTSSTTKKITVYVWMDGQDTGCKTDAVDTTYDVAEILSSIQLDFTLAPA